MARIAGALVLLAAAGVPSWAAGVRVWAIDDGERVTQDAPPPPLADGVDNPVWRPGEAIRLFALRDEVVAVQIVVSAGDAPLAGVTVEIALDDGAIGVERFVEHFFRVGRSSTAGSAETLGWAAGSGPPGDRFTGLVPDALIPVDQAPGWDPWPMRIAAGHNGVVWIDLTVPRDLPPAIHRGTVTVRDGGAALATLPLALEVLPATMPARPVATVVYYDRGELGRRVGDPDAAERQLEQLFHRHRIAPLHTVMSAADVRAQLGALDGSLYTLAAGYHGPAEGVGDGIVVLGTYGMLGDATPAHLGTVEAIADELAAHRLFDTADVVLYAEDENCRSERGAAWRARIAGSSNGNARRVRVGWTCSEDPARQPVDVPMVVAGQYDPARAAAASAAGKETWIYGGFRPATGTVHTDSEAISLRTLGWIAAMARIPRWFLWESTFWYDNNRGGRGPYNPFTHAETFHNGDGEAAMGDGVLVYPGRQLDGFGEHSLGIVGVVPSMRLKNLRRGIEDAGYLLLARAAAPAEADGVARALLPRILGEATPGAPPSWGERGRPFFEARRALAALIAPGAEPAPTTFHGVGAARGRQPERWHLRRRHWAALIAVAAALALAFVIRNRRRRGRPRL